ncbi:fumarylacetoacetate hydrolase family protein [Vibrio hannami]|uniref:fumarylacetoacetate hydrolase family protein n=1 Tax=Vibrio hannami TaxID=2717094 RepID=UPI00240FBB57|nr:fumarylacetoacetate hydrolase family protein [Vibrio hannami]MDG3087825.1 fumarylacetoacetate hydrolase family protein [Vibrio hannami]
MNTNQLVKGKLVCVALNDKAQLENLKETFNEKPYLNAPTQPVLYFKTHNTWSVDDADIDLPSDFQPLVVGASIGVVIGQRCCRVSKEKALESVSGLTLVHDFSLPETSYYRPDIKGKCLDGSAPIAQNAVPLSDISSVSKLSVETSVNGTSQRNLKVSDLERSIEQLISTISHIMTLEEGDVIAVGFPGERVPLNPGDKVSSNLICLTNSLLTLNNQVKGE